MADITAMTFATFITMVCRLASAFAVLAAGAPALAQVIQIEDDGSVVVQDRPAVTIGDDVQPLIMSTAAAARTMLNTPSANGLVTLGPLQALFAATARDVGIDARLLHAVAWHESRFRQDVVSNKGAIGMMQLMPDTARSLGVDPRDASQNVRGGARLLAQLLRRYGGDLDLTLAAYNAGPGAVSRYGGIPPFAETRAYVAQIKQMLFL